jgi:FixJ family two-component response regulator
MAGGCLTLYDLVPRSCDDTAARAAVSWQSGSTSKSMWQRARISIVDDDESCREALHELLKAYDFEVQIFCSAEELLASDAWLGSDCLLVDATLPGASGSELQTLLRARNNSIPVIFITGYDDAELKTRVIAAGAIDCICKPLEEDELFACLGKAMASRSRQYPQPRALS